MKRFLLRFAVVALIVSAFSNGAGARAAEPSVASNPAVVVTATYECLGLVWRTPDQGEYQLSYQIDGKDAWHPVLPLVYDARDGEYRGSIVGLKADTAYRVKLKAGEREAVVEARTRSDRFPIGETTALPAGDSTKTVEITKSGTAQGYHLVTPPAQTRSTIDVYGRANYNIVVDADYVIVRGVEARNAAIHSILIKAGHHDVVIEDCHLIGWGRIGGPVTFGAADGDNDSGIYAERGCGNLTLQRNLIERPRGASNDWETGHPSGPQGISVVESTGGNVIRYNEIVSTEDHGFNDGIGGGNNFSFVGNMHRDSDIYGNFVRGCWDDAIECEGGNLNVRIWGNYLDRFYNGIATACTSRGPLYIFRNVWAVSRRSHREPAGGAAIKTGERNEFGGGRRFVFHNTALQPGGVGDGFSSHPNPNCVTRNNIFACRGRLAAKDEKTATSDFDYDYFNGEEKGAAREPHGVRGPVAFLPSLRLEFYPAPRVSMIKYGKYPQPGDEKRSITDPVVEVANPVIDAGVVVPGFNDDFLGEAPDLGAFETGRPPLEFGRRAHLRFDEGWAPWERYP
ncbi:MAG: right-handed parallel beta-helix repeat-containing protein [Nibricoccus sp.]